MKCINKRVRIPIQNDFLQIHVHNSSKYINILANMTYMSIYSIFCQQDHYFVAELNSNRLSLEFQRLVYHFYGYKIICICVLFFIVLYITYKYHNLYFIFVVRNTLIKTHDTKLFYYPYTLYILKKNIYQRLKIIFCHCTRASFLWMFITSLY